MTTPSKLQSAILVLSVFTLNGCIGRQQPQNMVPPVAQNAPYAQPGDMQNGAQVPPSGQTASVYNWQDVPVNQNIPIVRATFDQSGYQIFASTGETIVIPFANNNLYVLKFGRSAGAPYFRNEANAPVLYVSPNDYLENAAAQNARWYPLPQDFAYSQPVYVGLAPSWNDYTQMGWYPGMNYYGGMWGSTPYYSGVHWMPSFYINIGGRRYSDYSSYHTYYVSNPGYVRTTRVYNYPATRSTGSFGSGRSTGSFGSGGAARSTGSFGSGTRSTGFGSHPGSAGSFGRGSAAPSAFGSTGSGGSFGSGVRRTGSSFGGGSGFGGGRTSGSSFGGGGSRSIGGGGGSFGRRH